MSKHNQDHHDGMEVHMSHHDGEQERGHGMKVCMSGDHEDRHEKSERGHGEKTKMNG